MVMPNTESNLTLLRLQVLKDFDNEVIDRLIGDACRSIASEQNALLSQAETIQANTLHSGVDTAWLLELLDDDRSLVDEVHKMVYELVIVALYKKIEITTRRAIQTACLDIPSKHLADAKKLKKHLNDNGINIKLLLHYSAMDEVRCLSHDIKHGSIVSSKLAAYLNWKKGESLEGLDVAYARLAPFCSSYLQELIDSLMQKRSSTVSSLQDSFDLDDSATE
jgi:hypothetical protein